MLAFIQTVLVAECQSTDLLFGVEEILAVVNYISLGIAGHAELAKI